MSLADDSPSSGVPVRREPPRFRQLEVRRLDSLSPRLTRVVVGGDELHGLVINEPASSVRLLLPPPGTKSLRMPEWTGNEFVLPDGERAPIRTFTPRHLDEDRLELTLDIVLHDRGVASDWARAASEGDEVAVSGPGRGFNVDPNIASYLLAGDETAIAAIAQLLEAIPSTSAVRVHVEIVAPSARIELPAHPESTVDWHVLADGSEPGSRLVDVIVGQDDLPEHTWVAGEAAAVQRIRRHLFEERGLSRSQATVRGYWKQGRSAT